MPDQHDAGEGEWKNPKVLWRVKPIQARKAERRYDVDAFDGHRYRGAMGSDEPRRSLMCMITKLAF